MAFKRVLVAAAAAASLAATAPAAAQASVLVHGSGDFFDNSGSDPLLGGPGDHFDFWVVVPESFIPIDDGFSGARTDRFADFSYEVNGVAVSGLDLTEVGFYSTADEGGMELVFSDRNLEIAGQDYGSTGVVTAPFHDESAFSLDVDLYRFYGYSYVDTSLSDIPVPAGVPEPATWALAVAGFGLAGTALRRQRRQPRPVATPAWPRRPSGSPSAEA